MTCLALMEPHTDQTIALFLPRQVRKCSGTASLHLQLKIISAPDKGTA